MSTTHKLSTVNSIHKAFHVHKGPILYIIFLIFSVSLLISCSNRPTSLPTTFTEITDSAVIYPDYRDVTIPPNIAPLNFMISDASADAFVADLNGVICGAGSDGKFDIDTTAWRSLLSENKGKDIRIVVYAQRKQGWVRYPSFNMYVAEEDIDNYLSYRLIEPGYELYRQLGLYQRNLTNFTQTTIYENNRSFDNDGNHCINCHNYQNYDTERMLFHVRAAHGGTVITHGTEAHKIAIKHDSILAAGVYPSWHPTLPLVAFSTNKTGQVFHLKHPEKIEVLDTESDLILYDAEHNEVRNVIRSTDYLETFPCWSPDGCRLYYCSARSPQIDRSNLDVEISARYDSLLYDIYSMPFDPATRSFGEPRLEIDASSQKMSCSVPRVSPDGRYLLYTYGQYGQFHIWHKSADLWVKRLRVEGSESSEDSTLNVYPLTAANSSDADSYHSWSSNGRWIVFSSRRDDGNFTRPYIAYFDTSGQAHRPFLLPQRDPESNLLLLKSYNVPELTRSAVRISAEEMNHVVRHTEAEKAEFIQSDK